MGTNANGEGGRQAGREGRGREEVGLGGIWAEDGERGSGKRTERERERERERESRKKTAASTNERTNALFATEFTTDAEIAGGSRSTSK